MKILFISMHYKPEPCDTRTSQLAAGMAKAGHKATVITSFPNYPFGKIYDGYKQKICKKEMIDGVNVVRVPMFPDHSMSKKRRALSYLSFGFAGAFLGSLFTRRPDIVWIHHPPLTTGIAGYILAKIKRVPFVYEIHDLWPQTLVSTGMVREGKVTKTIQRVCNFLHKRASAIVVTSPGMKRQLIADGTAAEKIFVFPQWAQQETISKEKDLEVGMKYGLNGKFNIFFTGNIGVAQGLDTILDAAKCLTDIKKLQITMVGAGVELDRLKRRAIDEEINNILFTGQVTHDEVQSLVPWADGLLVHLKHDPLFEITIPSKTQMYMASGRPILCGVNGDTADLIESAEGGICFPAESYREMANAVRKLFLLTNEEREVMGQNARYGYEDHCSKRVLLNQYEMLFADLLNVSLLPTHAVIEEAEEAKEVLHSLAA
jgi:glycosyltransferase involved in cell wall biosynthesis